MPDALIPTAQRSLEAFKGFTDEDREKIGWRNAFALFPSLKEKFPELGQ